GRTYNRNSPQTPPAKEWSEAGSIPPFSYEEAVERMSGGLKIAEVVAKLTDPQIYNPLSVRSSVELPYRLRNRIAHQGARITANHAKRAVDVNFVLGSALALRTVQPPPSTHSWQAKFGGVRPEVAADRRSIGGAAGPCTFGTWQLRYGADRQRSVGSGP